MIPVASATPKYQMRLNDFLIEMPIASLSAVGELGTGPSAKSFTMADWKVTHSEKAIAKIYRIFERTPYWFNFIVVFKRSDNIGRLMFDNTTSAEKLSEIVGKPVKTEGAITVVYNNHVTAAANRMPISAWTLAHRFGHAAHLNNTNNPSDHPVAALWSRIDAEVHDLFQSAFSDSVHTTTGKQTGRRNETNTAAMICTFKSARDNNMNSNWEVVADLFAQYLISGRISLYSVDEITQPLSVDLDTMSDQHRDRIDTAIAQAENELNACMKSVLDSLVGTIVGF